MKRLAFCFTSTLALCALLVSAALADGPQDDFTSVGSDGWVQSTNTLLLWWATKTLGSWPFVSYADGVIDASLVNASNGQLTEISKQVYLEAGQYRVIVRAAGSHAFWDDEKIWLSVHGDTLAQSGEYFGPTVNDYRIDHYSLDDNHYTEFRSAILEMLYPGTVTLRLRTNGRVWIDYIHIDELGITEPTATQPNWNATSTPFPYTPVPTEYRATPAPTGTRFCVAAIATATPGPGQYGTPEPTATPDAGAWGYLGRFNTGTLSGVEWSALGDGLSVKQDMLGPDSRFGVLSLPYGQGHAIILDHVVTPTTYVDGWAMADAANPIGTTPKIVAYVRDATDTWLEIGQQNISYGAWFPFHIVGIDPGGTPPYSYLAVSIMRDDNPTGGVGYIDDLYIYGSLTMAPRCDGTYPTGVELTPETIPTVPGTVIDIIDGRPCPPPEISSPNNFWGPILAEAQILFYQVTALFPLHISGDFYTPIMQLLESPIWRYTSVGAMLFDLRPILTLAMFILTLEAAKALYSAWRLLLKIIPAAG